MEYIHPKNRYSQSATRKQGQSIDLTQISKSFDFRAESLSIKKLSGGFMNANYLIQDNSKRAVLRVSATNSKTTMKEAALMNLVRDKGVKAPKCIQVINDGEQSYALHEYIEGLTLEDYLLNNQRIPEKTLNELGGQLAKIHSIDFQNNGLLDENLQICESFADIDKFALKYMQGVLSEVSEDKLPLIIKERLLGLLSDKWNHVEINSKKQRLTHSDFNPKNILVSESGELESILDLSLIHI